MSRVVSTGMAEELTARLNHPVWLVQIAFAEADLYGSGAPRTISWNGHDWQPLDVEVSDYSLERNGTGRLTLSFPGHNHPMAVSVAQGLHTNRAASVYLAYLDGATGDVVADPELVLSGRCSGGQVDDGGVSFSVLEGKGVRYDYAPRRWFGPESGFHHLPKDGEVLQWKNSRITLRARE